MIALQTLAPDDRDEMNHGPSTLIFRASSAPCSLPQGAGHCFDLILRGHQIDLVILERHDKLPAPLESACRWLSFFPLIKSSLK